MSVRTGGRSKRSVRLRHLPGKRAEPFQIDLLGPFRRVDARALQTADYIRRNPFQGRTQHLSALVEGCGHNARQHGGVGGIARFGQGGQMNNGA